MSSFRTRRTRLQTSVSDRSKMWKQDSHLNLLGHSAEYDTVAVLFLHSILWKLSEFSCAAAAILGVRRDPTSHQGLSV